MSRGDAGRGGGGAALPLTLEWGTPAPRATGAESVRAYKQRLCLYGAGGPRRASWRMDNAQRVYLALPEGVRVALRVAARAGLACDVGSSTAQDRSKYVGRATLATVRGAVPDGVAVVLTLAGFRRRAAHERDSAQWWGWKP